MPSVITDPAAISPVLAPPSKPMMTKLHIPPTADQQQPQDSISQRQSLPIIPPASATLAPPFAQRPIRSSPTVSPAKPTRTMSHPVLTHLPIQFPPTVPEENGISPETSPISPLYRQPGGSSSPVLERDSANSRYSMRPRASTTSVIRRNSLPAPQVGESLDEEAQRWAEEIRKKRESKRRWKEAEDEDRVIIGNKVDANHPNYITAYNMLTGLRVAVISLCIRLIVGISCECKDGSRIDRRRFHIPPEIHF